MRLNWRGLPIDSFLYGGMSGVFSVHVIRKLDLWSLMGCSGLSVVSPVLHCVLTMYYHFPTGGGSQ